MALRMDSNKGRRERKRGDDREEKQKGRDSEEEKVRGREQRWIQKRRRSGWTWQS